MGSGMVVVDVNAPPAVVLECLGSFEEYPQMIPVVRRAEVLSRTSAEGTTLARLNYRLSRFWLSVSVAHAVDPSAGAVRFDLDPSSSKHVLREASGSWHVEQAPGDHPGRSRVWLRVMLRASAVLPHWLLDYASERALRRASSWLRPHVERLWRRRQVAQLWREGRPRSRQELPLAAGGQLSTVP